MTHFKVQFLQQPYVIVQHTFHMPVVDSTYQKYMFGMEERHVVCVAVKAR